MKVFINSINANTYLAGIAMIMFNIGSRYLVVDMSKSTEVLLKTKIMRRLTLFSIFFVGTRDVLASLLLTTVFVIMTMGLFNENSRYFVLSPKFMDNEYTQEEYEFSKQIIAGYEQINNIEASDRFCGKNISNDK
jgi:hypothetical protein